jgi:hypothetical protein
MANKVAIAITIGVGVVGIATVAILCSKRKPESTASFNPWIYDINGSGRIDTEGAMLAIDDNLAGRLTFKQLQSVLNLTHDKELLAAIGVSSNKVATVAAPSPPTKRQPVDIEPAAPSQPASTYTNEETWDIEWSRDGVPTRITVHRNAKRT